MTRRQRSSTLFPYTTLFRSGLKTTTTSDSCASYEEKPYDGNWSSRWREALKPYSYDSTSAPFLDQGMSLSSNAASPSLAHPLFTVHKPVLIPVLLDSAMDNLLVRWACVSRSSQWSLQFSSWNRGSGKKSCKTIARRN